jgi:hypothetical protein
MVEERPVQLAIGNWQTAFSLGLRVFRGTLKSVRPRLAVQAYTGTLAARIAEVTVECQATRLRIEVHDEQAMVAVFAR